ncbi:hypothetical protein Athai_48160 [Actinocatenispora thailandica]|uniref:HlyD family secretion protein n=1 Tax=Actinocatenispora thailandica TaxID=227318 RepID=A0A7R7HZR2_9ACTN|nr:hypothetical protein [Actinocatenispora thailandica]BCJ37313.1 hypothetical protein Athai_48160 [Actinocatenispora thailandica]
MRFRAQALRHYERGERLDEPLRLASVPVWIGALVVFAVLVAGAGWSLLVRLPTELAADGVLHRDAAGWQAEVSVPFAAVAPVRAGQPVSLTLRSVPAAVYGTLSGRTVGVSAATATSADAAPRATVRIRIAVTAGGEPRWSGGPPPFAVPPGTPVRARIVVARQRAIEWVLAR